MDEKKVSEKAQDAELTGAAENCELTNEELSGVTGGHGGELVGQRVYVDGPIYITSYGEDCAGHVSGYFYIQKYISGRKAPYLLRTNVGWMEPKSIHD